MAKEIRNLGASVRARLLQLAKASGQSFDLVLTRLALEQLLFRLSQSPHAGRFVLKGAMLMMSCSTIHIAARVISTFWASAVPSRTRC